MKLPLFGKYTERSFARLAYSIFPKELSGFYEENIGLCSLLRRVREENEKLAFDIWLYLLLRTQELAGKRFYENRVINAFEFYFDAADEPMYLSALCRDPTFRKTMFQTARTINERQVWLLFLTLKYGEYAVFDDCMHAYLQNPHRVRYSAFYSTDRILLEVIERLRGSVEETYMQPECYRRILCFARQIDDPYMRHRVLEEAKSALQFTSVSALTAEERKMVLQEKTARAVTERIQDRVRERTVKQPLFRDGATAVPYRIAGILYHLSAEEVRELLCNGTQLVLKQEPENRHDTCAVALHLPEGRLVGYLGKPYNRAFFDMLSEKIALIATVTETVWDVTGVPTVWVTIFKKE